MSSDFRSPGLLFSAPRRPFASNPNASASASISAAHPIQAVPSQPINVPNPSFAPSTPSTDIFASSPQQSSLSGTPPSSTNSIRDMNRFETAGGTGSKTVHWSPALVQQNLTDRERDRDRSERGERSERNASFAGSDFTFSQLSASPYGTLPRSAAASAAKAVNSNNDTQNGAPPLRSLRSALEPVNKSRRISIFDQLPSQQQSSRQRSSESAADTWIVVFGFPSDYATSILKLFSKHAQIVSHQSAPRGNWMYIRYSCAAHAQQALARNGMILDGSVRIGVMPATEEELASNDIENAALPVNGQSANLDDSTEPNVIPAISFNTTTNNTSFNTSVSGMPARSGTPRSGMRPLSMSFRQEVNVFDCISN
ncbi:hypothetical protein WR25_22119 [Diploscapter pachys]|uniref:Nucleoporin NUP35 n=1 Tax=Diploscapter pachys TaxID=2018661 RepID=A0A2A2M0Q9_9BILA|nr:hypothetical protein WR25_22119 [Diploscapter pachys]